MYILVLGNVVDGFKFKGLFSSTVEANSYGEDWYADTEWWVVAVDMVHPIDIDIETINNKNICSCGHLWSNHEQNIHRIYVCRECNCRTNAGPST